jgi:hypothetical protein
MSHSLVFQSPFYNYAGAMAWVSNSSSFVGLFTLTGLPDYAEVVQVNQSVTFFKRGSTYGANYWNGTFRNHTKQVNVISTAYGRSLPSGRNYTYSSTRTVGPFNIFNGDQYFYISGGYATADLTNIRHTITILYNINPPPPTITDIVKSDTIVPSPVDNKQLFGSVHLPPDVINATLTTIEERRTHASLMTRGIVSISTVEHVRIDSTIFPLTIPTPFVRVISSIPIDSKPAVRTFSISSLTFDETLYIVSDETSEPFSLILPSETLIFTKTLTGYSVNKNSGTFNYNEGDEFSYDGFKIIIGSITVIRDYKPINFILSSFNTEIMIDTLATINKQNILPSTADAVGVIEIGVNTVRNMFKFQTDASDIDPDIDGNDITYYIYPEHCPNINIAHASTYSIDLSEFPSVQTGTQDINTWGIYGNFLRNRSMLKHDYIRYLADKLFNTYHGADLFNNEQELKNSIVYLGNSILENIKSELTSSNEKTNADLNSIGRDLLDQIAYHDIERLRVSENGIIATTEPQPLPLHSGDTIIFNVIINSAEDQHMLTSVPPISSRTYRIILKIVNTPNNQIPDDLSGLDVVNGVDLSIAENVYVS